jgi:hypothetical protein
VPGGKLRDTIRVLCPGPRCPMACAGGRCVIDPGPVREPPLTPADRLHAPILKLPLDRFTDPRISRPGVRSAVEVRPR